MTTTPDDSMPDAPLDELLRGAVHELRTPVSARAQAVQALKAAVHSDASTTTRGAPPVDVVPIAHARRGWLTTPRTLQLSPLTLLAATMMLVLGVSAITARLTRGSGDIARASTSVPSSARLAATTSADAQVVRFTLTAPTAERVALVGDFNNWDPTITTLQQQNGTWTVVIPVTPGRHQYGFVVDGSRWIPDPSAAQSADSDFGSSNSVVYVGG
jgi:Carbohydrate-binding module 48 (Isoamylase N-terminal domain)